MKRFDFALVGSFLNEAELRCFIELFNILKRRGYSCVALTGSNEDEHILKEKNIPVINFYKGSRKYTFHDHAKLLRECKLLSEKYNLPNLRYIIFAEKCYNKRKEDFLLKRAVAFFRFAEDLIESIDFGCFVNNEGEEIIRLALEYVGRKKGIPSFYLGSFPAHFENKMFIYDNAMHFMDSDFKIIPYEKMNYKEVKFAEELINSVKKDRKVINYNLGINKKHNLVIRKVKKLIKHIKFKDYERLSNAIKYNLEIVKKKTILSPMNRLFVTNKLPEHFIFYPLHVVDDSQITFRNPHFYRQDFLIDVIAGFIPEGYSLVVKPHPGLKGLLSLKMIKEIKSIPNVVLVDPKINAHYLIEKSDAVIIINSTVGFEALFYFKPVIVMGNWTLKGYGVTIDVENLFDLPWAIRKALEIKKVDERKIISFIYSIYKAMYDGSLYTSERDYEKIANSLIEKAKKKGVVK